MNEWSTLLIQPFTTHSCVDLLNGAGKHSVPKESRHGNSPMALEVMDPHTQLMRTNLGRPELGSFTLQKAYITFPLLSSSTSSSRPPSAESKGSSEVACTPAHQCLVHLYFNTQPTCLRTILGEFKIKLLRMNIELSGRAPG